MPVINKKPRHSKVEFVSYVSSSYNLCTGTLTLKVDGKEYRFGIEDGMYPRFWTSGGGCGFRNGYGESYIYTVPWIIDENDLPDELKQYSDEIDQVFNENVQFGCCGGCL